MLIMTQWEDLSLGPCRYPSEPPPHPLSTYPRFHMTETQPSILTSLVSSIQLLDLWQVNKILTYMPIVQPKSMCLLWTRNLTYLLCKHSFTHLMITQLNRTHKKILAQHFSLRSALPLNIITKHLVTPTLTAQLQVVSST